MLEQYLPAVAQMKELEETIRGLNEEIRVKDLTIQSALQEIELLKQRKDQSESDQKNNTNEMEELEDYNSRGLREIGCICHAIIYALPHKSASEMGTVCKAKGLHIGFVKDESRSMIIGIEENATVIKCPDKYISRRLGKYLASVKPVDSPAAK